MSVISELHFCDKQLESTYLPKSLIQYNLIPVVPCWGAVPCALLPTSLPGAMALRPISAQLVFYIPDPGLSAISQHRALIGSP